jgi:hypothetical protein
MPFHYNPENVEVLRIQTEGVCAKLDELHERLRNRQLALDDLKQDYVRLYQPEAIALAEAMLHHHYCPAKYFASPITSPESAR